VARHIPRLIEAALDRLRLWSNDPICADHDPSITADERSLLGAACHACLLVLLGAPTRMMMPSSAVRCRSRERAAVADM
jgi:hypothetical protein